MPETFDVFRALRERHHPDAWAYFTEVRNGTGFAKRVTRTADAVAFSLWPSRGLELHGFEVKVSRSDWLRELKTPEKAEELFQFCDRWWLAVADAEIVKPGELPASWGLLVPRGKALVVKVEAPKLDAKPLDRPFLASLFRNIASTHVSPSHVEDLVKRRVEAEKLDWEHQNGVAHWRRSHQALLDKVKKFEEAAGVTIGHDWESGDIGKAVAFVRQHGVTSAIDDVRRQVQILKNLAAHGERLLSEAPCDVKAVADVA